MGQVNLSAMFINSVSNTGTNSSNVKAASNQSSTAFSQSLLKAKTSSQTQSSSNVDSRNNVKETRTSKDKVKEDTATAKNIDRADQVKNPTKKVETVKKSDKKEDTAVAVDKTVDEPEDKESDQVSEKILVLVAQALNLSVDEVKQTLEKLGLQPEALMTQEGFGKFVSEGLGKGDISQLLTGSAVLKKINQLFEEIQSLSHQQAGDMQEDHTLLNLRVNVQNSTENTGSSDAQGQEETKLAQGDIMEKQVGNAEIPRNERYEEIKAAAQGNTAQNTQQVTGAEGTGLTVSVHNFATTTTFTQVTQSPDGMLTQTTVTKQADGSHFVLEQVDFKTLGQTKELSVQLSPKELGTMNIKIVENNGALVAEIKVDNEKIKSFIVNELVSLKDNLEQQGLNVTEVKVDIRQDNGRSQMEQERQKSSKRIQEIINEQYGEEDEAEEIQSVIASGSEVDYMV